ncbi:MAG: head-tail adaptor protein [Saprospiraceae bacterium]|nr:head-tail adaptor protein [Saprospiraceae bacterium]
MDRLVTIRNTSSPVANVYGEVTSTTNTDVIVNAAYSYAGKDESQLLNKETNIKYEYFVIRYGITVTMTSKLIHEGSTYDVVNIEPVGRQAFYKLKCKLVV